MASDHRKLCTLHGLNYTEPRDLALRRRKCGRGFKYVRNDGSALKDPRIKEAIGRLAIPPAWTEVCISEDPEAHLQAVGRDAAGRLQYRYHPRWDDARARSKEKRLLRFGKALPRIRRAVSKALREPGISREKATAAVVRLIDRALLRPGHERYAKEHGVRGAATLLKSDIAIDGNRVALDFIAKGGKHVHREFTDPLLAEVLRELAQQRGRPRLFTWGRKNRRSVSARDVNQFLATVGGEPVSAKDFRTFRASADALAELCNVDPGASEKEQNRAIIAAVDRVREQLANTRAVARSSYIHPSVIEAYQSAKLKPSLLKAGAGKGLKRMEAALLRFLESKRGAPRLQKKTT